MSCFHLILLALASPSALFATSPAQPGITLSAPSGKAPFTVTIKGPLVLIEKAQACKSFFGSVGFSIDWGDGSPRAMGGAKPDCTKLLTHTYTVPGKFTLQVAVFHPGPTDAPIYDYQGSQPVEVTGEAGKTKPSVKILAGKEELAPLYYGTGLRPLRYLVETTVPLELKGELLKDNGAVLLSESVAASFSGTDQIRWNKYGDGPPAEEYVNGRIKARYRITATKEGKSVAQHESPYFTIHANATFRDFELTPVRGKAPLEVVTANSFPHAECASYIVDWGDGTPDETGGTFSGKKGCTNQSYRVELKHKYAKRGTYTLRWYDNSGNPFKPASKGPGYMEKQVKVD